MQLFPAICDTAINSSEHRKVNRQVTGIGSPVMLPDIPSPMLLIVSANARTTASFWSILLDASRSYAFQTFLLCPVILKQNPTPDQHQQDSSDSVGSIR